MYVCKGVPVAIWKMVKYRAASRLGSVNSSRNWYYIICMYVYMYSACMYVWCMYDVCMMYVCMYVCKYVWCIACVLTEESEIPREETISCEGKTRRYLKDDPYIHTYTHIHTHATYIHTPAYKDTILQYLSSSSSGFLTLNRLLEWCDLLIFLRQDTLQLFHLIFQPRHFIGIACYTYIHTYIHTHTLHDGVIIGMSLHTTLVLIVIWVHTEIVYATNVKYVCMYVCMVCMYVSMHVSM